MPDSQDGLVTDLSAVAREMAGQQQQPAQPWTRPVGFDAATALFGPGRPVTPLHPEEKPRVFEYQPGINLVSIPRAGFGLASFSVLRSLATACKEIRFNIELIKREIRALEWDIVPVNKEAGGEGANDVRAFMESPDGDHEFDQWLNILLEEMLSIDAPCLYPDVDEDGRLHGIEIVAGDTIRPILDIRGRVSRPPLPAYIQMIHGTPLSWFTRDSLLYRPFNVSASSPYGTSPIEFFILTVNLALRRETFHVSSFAEGNIPEALAGAPASWNQEQIESWQKWWDALIGGKAEEQAKLKWVPVEGGRGSIPIYEFRKDDITSTARDEWLMRVACWAFGNSPAEFGITPQQGLGGKGFTESMENVQYRSMLGPITQFLANSQGGGLINYVIHRWLHRPNLMFRWLGFDPQEDKLQQAQIDQYYIGMGAYDLAYVQERLGVPAENRPKDSPLRSGLVALPGLGQFMLTTPTRYTSAQAITDMPAQTAPEQTAEPTGEPSYELSPSQTTSILEIVSQVGSGEMPRDSGLNALEILFNIPRERAETLLGNAAHNLERNPKLATSGGSPVGKFFRFRSIKSSFTDYG